MKPKRILVNALAVREGGSYSYMINLMRELARDDRGLDWTILAPPDGLEEVDWSGGRLERVSLPGHSLLRLPARILYEQMILPRRARGFDLLYCVADMCPAWGSTPMVVLMKNLNIYDRQYYDDVRTNILVRLVRLGAPRARFAVFPSQAAADRIRHDIPIRPDRARVVHYGIDASAFDAAGRPVNLDEPYLFLAAAPERHKGIHTLISALRHFEGRAPLVVIAGDSSLDPAYMGELQDLAEREGVAERVRFIGRVPYRDLLSYYRGAQAMVFPSMLESFGHPVLEAMVAGTPIVASDIPAFRELAGNVALLVPPGDPRALAAAVERLEREPEATAARVEKGRRRAAEYSWKSSIDSLCRVFEQVFEA
ncbi:MAG: glycosyltransferase family 4 protein [Deltaproteobacteria bacterium]|nr:glycosyltransferase family 4 protein [Deltaproteobacteria bacterium]